MKITFKTRNSTYEINTVTNQYRKDGGEWIGCVRGGTLSPGYREGETYGLPIVGDSYLLVRAEDLHGRGKEVVTTPVASVETNQ